MSTSRHSWSPKRGARGAAALEFALVAGAFFVLLIGILEFGRVLFYWNSLAEATRQAARMAVVCDLNDATIAQRVANFLPASLPVTVTVTYSPGGCSAASCQLVTVTVDPGTQVSTLIPFLSIAPEAPPFTTTLPRESMNSVGGTNPTCRATP